MCLEEFVEDALVGEVEKVHNFLDGLVGVFEEVLCFQDHERVNPVRGAAAAGELYQLGKVLGRETELVGIELHIALRKMILRHQRYEVVVNLHDAGIV